MGIFNEVVREGPAEEVTLEQGPEWREERRGSPVGSWRRSTQAVGTASANVLRQGERGERGGQTV